MDIVSLISLVEKKTRNNESLSNIYIDNIMGEKNCIILSNETKNIVNVFGDKRDISPESKMVIFLDDEISNIAAAIFNFGDILEDCLIAGFLSPHLLLELLSGESSEIFNRIVFVLDYNLKTTINGVGVLKEILNISKCDKDSFPAIIWTGNGPDVTSSEEYKNHICKYGVKVLDKLYGHEPLLNELQKHNIRTLF